MATYRCPLCGNTDLRVDISVVSVLVQGDDETLEARPIKGSEWYFDDRSPMFCSDDACGYSAPSVNFRAGVLLRDAEETVSESVLTQMVSKPYWVALLYPEYMTSEYAETYHSGPISAATAEDAVKKAREAVVAANRQGDDDPIQEEDFIPMIVSHGEPL